MAEANYVSSSVVQVMTPVGFLLLLRAAMFVQNRAADESLKPVDIPFMGSFICKLSALLLPVMCRV